MKKATFCLLLPLGFVLFSCRSPFQGDPVSSNPSPLSADATSASKEETVSSQEEVVSSEPAENKKAIVLVLSGQSNMEGSTYFDNGKSWLKNYLDERAIDSTPFFSGMAEVQTSFRGYYPYGGWGDPSVNCHASNTTDRMAGLFLPTKVGMGASDVDIGPEIGLSYSLRDLGSADKPVFLIKSAFSGSGFSKSNYNWKTDADGGEGCHLWSETKTFVHNNLALIEKMGFEPEIKAWLWHQGETDSNSVSDATNYLTYMRDLLTEFRGEFASYAPQGEGNNIAFVDCTIYDGTRLRYTAVDSLNATKKTLAADSPHNFLINASTKDEGGLKLEIGGQGDIGGCHNVYHYTTADCFRLGEAYGAILRDNGVI